MFVSCAYDGRKLKILLNCFAAFVDVNNKKKLRYENSSRGDGRVLTSARKSYINNELVLLQHRNSFSDKKTISNECYINIIGKLRVNLPIIWRLIRDIVHLPDTCQSELFSL